MTNYFKDIFPADDMMGDYDLQCELFDQSNYNSVFEIENHFNGANQFAFGESNLDPFSNPIEEDLRDEHSDSNFGLDGHEEVKGVQQVDRTQSQVQSSSTLHPTIGSYLNNSEDAQTELKYGLLASHIHNWISDPEIFDAYMRNKQQEYPEGRRGRPRMQRERNSYVLRNYLVNKINKLKIPKTQRIDAETSSIGRVLHIT